MKFELQAENEKVALKVVEAFAGIGAQQEALRLLNIKTHTHTIEIDSNASKAYSLLHDNASNLGDITKVETLPKCDLFTYSFPCTNISTLNPKQGFDTTDDTASSLLWACQHLIEKSQPQYLLMENVANILNSTHHLTLKKWISFLDSLGYYNKLVHLQGYLFNIPQIRNRVFLLSSKTPFELEDTTDCKVISTVKNDLTVYQLERITPYTVKLDDFLEKNVPTKYYLSDLAVERLHRSKNQLVIKHTNKNNPINSHTIHKNYFKMDGKTQQYVWDLDTKRIRRFTPRECYRLMGWTDDRINQILPYFSDTTHYQLTGNSIIIPILQYLFDCLLQGYKK